MIRRAILLAALLAAGCNRPPDSSLHDAIVNGAIEAHDDRLNTLDNEFTDLDEHLPTTAILQTSEHGFSPIVTTVGTFTVAVKDVSAYASGSRLRLVVGNPTSGAVLRMKMHLAYGPRLGPASDLHQRDFEVAYPITGGARHEFDIDLPGVPPAQLEWVTISSLEIESYVLRLE